MTQETYKYFAWKEKGYWRGQELLSRTQINGILGALAWKREVFASIQNYDEFGNCLGSPLYFDLDGSPERVTFDTRHFVQACEFVVNVTPRIYFSGNKGFHLIIDYMVNHPLCHLLVKDFAEEIVLVKTLDTKVYRTQAQFRIPTSPASADGYYKIQITRDELFNLTFDEIKALAKTRRIIKDDHDPEKIDNAVMEAWLKTAIAKLPSYENLNDAIRSYDSLNDEMTPCVHKMLTEPQDHGRRHESLFIIARLFKMCGMDYESTKKVIESYAHWSLYEQQEKEVTKVLRSVFFSKKPWTIGCRGPTSSATLMRAHCDNRCHFHENFPKFNVTDSRGVSAVV